MERIAAAGNTEVPACLAIRSLGFALSRQFERDKSELWIAEANDLRFLAESPLELLGLCTMWKLRGATWRASDEEVDDFLKEFYPK